MLLSDFIYVGGEFKAREISSIRNFPFSAIILGELKISGKKYLIEVRQPYKGMAKIIKCCGGTLEEASELGNELLALRTQSIRENWNGIKGVILKRFFNYFLWSISMVTLLLSVLSTLYVAFCLGHPLFAIFFFVPLFAMFVYGIKGRVALTEPLYGSKESEIWMEDEVVVTTFGLENEGK